MTALSKDQLFRIAPSIFAEQAHHEVSDRYAFVPTTQVIDLAAGLGFQPVWAAASKTRREGHADFGKHMIRFRRETGVASTASELVLVNSHNRSSGLRLIAGTFRFICSNGMICGDIDEDFSVRHLGEGDASNVIIDGCIKVAETAVRRTEEALDWQRLTLSRGDKLALANAALEVRYGEERKPFEPAELLMPRRWDDKKDDLWTVTNTIQENVMRGGISGRSASGRRSTTRPVTSITEDVRLNRGIMGLARYFASQKS